MRRLLPAIGVLLALGVILIWVRPVLQRSLSPGERQPEQKGTASALLPIVTVPSNPTSAPTSASTAVATSGPTTQPNPSTTVPTTTPAGPPVIALTPAVSGLEKPVFITNAGDGSGRVFVVEQPGRIRIVKNGELVATPFLDIASRVSLSSERGLLSVAFPPDYTTKAHFYVYYTNKDGNIVVARYRLGASADVADSASEQIVITIAHPVNANHNGGQLAFGADGYLYFGTGDGGGAGDQNNNAQNQGRLLGKLLRIDVETNNPATYTIPASNPFASASGAQRCDPLPTSGNVTCQEIWAIGMRNPWRFAFDRQTHDLYIADVGQGEYEEIDFQPASSAGGENYGWRCKEGLHDYNLSAGCDGKNFVPPVTEYDHTQGNCSVTGGTVYRGTQFARMQGMYFYGDYCSGRIWGLRRNGNEWQSTPLLDTDFQVTTFGEDEAGNLYVSNYGGGAILQVTDTGA